MLIFQRRGALRRCTRTIAWSRSSYTYRWKCSWVRHADEPCNDNSNTLWYILFPYISACEYIWYLNRAHSLSRATWHSRSERVRVPFTKDRIHWTPCLYCYAISGDLKARVHMQFHENSEAYFLSLNYSGLTTVVVWFARMTRTQYSLIAL